MNSVVVTPQPSLIALMIAIIDRPRSTLQTIRLWHGTAVWLVPLALLLLSSVPMTIVQVPYNKTLAQQQVQRQMQQLPEEQRKEAAARMEIFTTTPILVAGGLLGGFFSLLASLASQAVWLYLGASVIGGDVSFGMMWRLSVWSRFPYAISWLAQTGFTLVASRAVRYPGLSALIATGNLLQDSRNPLFALLGSIDPFWFWHVMLVAVSLSVAQLRRGAVISLTLSYIVLSLAIQTVPTLFFGGG